MALFSGKKLRLVFALIGLAFIFSLLQSLSERSIRRTSLVGIAGLEESSVEEPIEQAAESKFHIQDFHRVQLREGKPAWEIKAKEAKHFGSEGLTYVTEAELIVFRPKGGDIKLAANTARLLMDGDLLKGAELEGNIRVKIEPDFEVHAENAFFDSTARKITSASEVEIYGSGYVIEGVGLELFLERQNMTLRENVRSRFDSSAEAPALEFSAS